MASDIRNDNGSSPLSSPSSSTFRSVSDGVDTPLFHSLQSSPELIVVEHEHPPAEDQITENGPLLVRHANNFGTFPDFEHSMSLSFSGSESSRLSCCETTRKAFKMSKSICLSIFALAFSVLFAWHPEVSETGRLFCISHSIPQYIRFPSVSSGIISVEISGPFPDEDEGNTAIDKNITIGLSGKNGTVITEPQSIPVSIHVNSSSDEEKFLPMKKKLKLNISNNACTHIALTSNTSYPVAVSLIYFVEPMTFNSQVIVAFIILIGVYILIIFELVHRAVAAMLGALAGLSVLSYVNRKPPLETVLTWLEWETLALLFGMMVLIAVFAKTGFFDYIALKAYKISRGHVWRLITLLCACTAIISALLDNVTVILLLTPVTVRLCQVLNLNPTYVLIAEVIFSNIGGTATAIGDPPNVIIVSNKDIKAEHIGFSDFTAHLTVGIFFCIITGYITLRLLYCKVKIVNDDSPMIEELKREAEIWRRTAERVPLVSAEEKTVKLLLLQKTMIIENTISNLKRTTSRREAFQQNLQELESKYVIKDRMLLMKSTAVIVLVVILLFFQSMLNLRSGWIAVLGAMILILLADIKNIEDLMEQVEWTTLVFFAGLSILMESLNELGLMEFLSHATVAAIKSVEGHSRLPVALVTIVWFSAFVSSFVDNIPFTTAMIPVVLELYKQAGIALKPLVWALAMGSCLGGNGTLIGASANVVCAGLAEQYGYPISFNRFFKVGFPVMIVTTATATGYLLIIYRIFYYGDT